MQVARWTGPTCQGSVPHGAALQFPAQKWEQDEKCRAFRRTGCSVNSAVAGAACLGRIVNRLLAVVPVCLRLGCGGLLNLFQKNFSCIFLLNALPFKTQLKCPLRHEALHSRVKHPSSGRLAPVRDSPGSDAVPKLGDSERQEAYAGMKDGSSALEAAMNLF